MKCIDYAQKSADRVNYDYADFLKDCQTHHIHDDISRAVWNLSRFLMHQCGFDDYRPCLTDNLCADYGIDFDDIFWEIEDKVWDGLDLQPKEEDNESYSSKYPAFSILNILDGLNYHYREDDYELM